MNINDQLEEIDSKRLKAWRNTEKPMGSRESKKLREDQLLFIWEHREQMDSADILYWLSRMGLCPNLIYDDNGGWYCETVGIQAVVTDKTEEFSIGFVIETKDKKDYPRKAIVSRLKTIISLLVSSG